MKNLHSYVLLFFFGIICIPNDCYAQELAEVPTDDLGDVSDQFQEHFFEALKQKGIENYELALDALRKAENAAKGDTDLVAVVTFEMGKNNTELGNYDQAEAQFKNVLQDQGDRLDVLEALYNLYYLERDYDAAIPLVQRLQEFDEDYKEDLANLYHRTRQYDKALSVLDELDELWGESDYRNALRTQIYRATGNTSGEIENLEGRIDANPKNEREYLNLIYLYSEEGDTEKAFETAKTLLRNNPQSKLVHLALYKFYLDEGNTSEALNSMKIVFSAQQIDKESNYKVLGDFIQFVNTYPAYETELETIVSGFSEDISGQVYEKLGDYYITKQQRADALKYYEKGIAIDPDNFSLLKNTLLLQIDFNKFDAAASTSKSALEIFPAQPILYLLNGVANNQLEQPELAIESLETGIDYLFDDPQMEKDFYTQLQIAYQKKGDTKKAQLYADKAAQINLPN